MFESLERFSVNLSEFVFYPVHKSVHMITTSFFLLKGRFDKNGALPIMISISLNNNRIKKTINGFRCKPEEWLDSKRRVKNSILSNGLDGKVINRTLDMIEANLKIIGNDSILKGKSPDLKFIISKLDSPYLLNPSQPLISEIIDDFIEEQKGVLEENTIKGYNTLKEFLKNYSEHAKVELFVNSFNEDQILNIRKYASGVKGYRNNYLAKIFATINRLMNWSIGKGLLNESKFQKIKVSYQKKEVVYLEKDELNRLLNFQFDSPRMDAVRDFFCFECFTGLRYSDMNRISQGNIKNGYIEKRQKKTNDLVYIPLTNQAIAILEKYKNSRFETLPKFSNVEINRVIKDCCKKAGIDSEITISHKVGIKTIEETGPKYQFVTNHTARKTNATLSLIFGASIETVKNTLGHKNYENLEPYIAVSNVVSKRETQDAWTRITEEESF